MLLKKGFVSGTLMPNSISSKTFFYKKSVKSRMTKGPNLQCRRQWLALQTDCHSAFNTHITCSDVPAGAKPETLGTIDATWRRFIAFH